MRGSAAGRASAESGESGSDAATCAALFCAGPVELADGMLPVVPSVAGAALAVPMPGDSGPGDGPGIVGDMTGGGAAAAGLAMYGSCGGGVVILLCGPVFAEGVMMSAEEPCASVVDTLASTIGAAGAVCAAGEAAGALVASSGAFELSCGTITFVAAI